MVGLTRDDAIIAAREFTKKFGGRMIVIQFLQGAGAGTPKRFVALEPDVFARACEQKLCSARDITAIYENGKKLIDYA